MDKSLVRRLQRLEDIRRKAPGDVIAGLERELAETERQLAKTRAALERLLSYAAGVWYDEADAVDEEREEMQHARDALKEKDPPG